jgi:NAD-dependent SIR2 family protein deacetylase
MISSAPAPAPTPTTPTKLFDGSAKAAHGRVGRKFGWALPVVAVECALAVRPDQRNNTTADEMLDTPEVLDAKVDLLIRLMRAAGPNSIVYSGAGISRAAGIPDYASKAANSLSSEKKLSDPGLALPSLAHRILTALHHEKGWIGQWINQNHDGLAQKAGFPESLCNSIHGDWFDPSNPVVQFSGNLRSDLFARMLDWEKRATLSLCLGTSLSGMNADRMAESPALRQDIRNCNVESASQFGTVIVNLQRTRLDDQCTLRIWARIDDVFRLLAEKLQLAPALFEMPPQPFPALPAGTVFALPRYDADGAKMAATEADSAFRLDLTPGARVRIANREAPNKDAVGEMREQDRAGNFVVAFSQKGKLTRVYTLGRWWLDAALKGEIEQLPLVNQ